MNCAFESEGDITASCCKCCNLSCGSRLLYLVEKVFEVFTVINERLSDFCQYAFDLSPIPLVKNS